MLIKFYVVLVKIVVLIFKVYFVWRGGEIGIFEGSDDCVLCLVGKLVCGKSYFLEFLVIFRIMEG